MNRKTDLPLFVTLGPKGTNHEMVTSNYPAFHNLDGAGIVLVDEFNTGLELIAAGEADFMVQVAVHPSCAEVVATAHFKFGIRILDTFISPSKPLAILTRADVIQPKTLALQPATQTYTNLDRWQQLIPVGSIIDVANGLVEGKYDSGLTTLSLAEQYPGRFKVDVDLGTVDDPWLVFGKQNHSSYQLQAWPDSPAARLFRNTPGPPAP